MSLDRPATGSDAYLVQLFHPEKMLGFVPAPGRLDDLLTEPVLGVDPVDAAALRTALAQNCRAHARRLADTDPDLRREIGALRAGLTLAAVGDSITDDLQSWAHLLDELLGSRAGAPGWRILNFGRSGDTTADLLSRFRDVLLARPAVVVLQVGTNDAKHLAHAPERTLVSAAETVRNVAALDRAARMDGAQVLWILPPTPDFARIEVCAPFVEGGMSWNPDTFAAMRRGISTVVGSQVDADDAMTDPEDLLDDGLHPSVLGQVKICRVVVAALGKSQLGMT